MESYRFQTLELALYFVVLALVYMTVSCLKLWLDSDSKGALIRRFEQAIIKSEGPTWRVVFFIVKYLHIVVLMSLFVDAMDGLNTFRGLGFLTFLIVYTASEWLYRKTSRQLSIFISFFILGQYYTCLIAPGLNLEDPGNLALEKNLAWFGLYTHPATTGSYYFRHNIQARDWIILLMISCLQQINVFFEDGQRGGKLSKHAQDYFKQHYKRGVYAFIRYKNSLNRYAIWVAVILNFHLLRTGNSSLISWIFFVLNALNFAFIIRQDNKVSTNRHAFRTSYTIKMYSALILVSHIFFSAFIGELESPDGASFDQKFKQRWPTVYAHLQFIGYRTWRAPGAAQDAAQNVGVQLKAKFVTYIASLATAIYLESYFWNKINNFKEEGDFSEEHYKLLFECHVYETRKEEEDSLPEQHMTADVYSDRRSAADEPLSGDSCQSEEDEAQHSVFQIKKQYTELDLRDHYEYFRYSPEFLAYKMMDYWPLLDSLATYGHILNNLIVVMVALRVSTSFLMCFCVCLVCVFYTTATLKLHFRANQNLLQSGLQSQTDLKMAQIIVKKYKTESFSAFLKIRAVVWKVQLVFVLVSSCIGFPTDILQQVRRDLRYQDKINNTTLYAERIETIDQATFYLFLSGLYKATPGPNATSEWRFYLPFILMAIGLYFERLAINWLTNRNGCDYRKLQKLIELDLRIEAISEKWPVQSPLLKYDIDDYKPFYFYEGFAALKERFIESQESAGILRKQSLGNEELRDFIPHRVAKRIKSLVEFTVRLKGRQLEGIELKENRGLREFLQAEESSTGSAAGFAFLDGDFQNYQRDLIVIGHEDEQLVQNKNRIREAGPSDNFSDVLTAGIGRIRDDQIEDIPLLRDYKIECLQTILNEGIERKYKISFAKGVKIVLESLIVLTLMISAVLKANVFSIVYMIFIIRFLASDSRIYLLVHMVVIISFAFIAQYLVYILNLTSNTSAAPFPSRFGNYPQNKEPGDLTIKYAIPLFFQIDVFRDLHFTTFVGIGVENSQTGSLLFDFFNLYLVSMYIASFRNPILARSLRKIFWRFPSKIEEAEKWDRLSPEVRKQVNWLYQPVDINGNVYEQKQNYQEQELIQKKISQKIQDGIVSQVKYSPAEKAHCSKFEDVHAQIQASSNKEEGLRTAQMQFQFAKNYNRHQQFDLDCALINFVDLKYQQIWSKEFCKRIKRQLKEQNIYFRLVKQGSALVYLTFHVFTIAVVLLMAVLSQSILSLGYVFMILPHLRDGADVFSQKDIMELNFRQKLEEEIEQLSKQIDEMTLKNDSKIAIRHQLKNLNQELKQKEKKLAAISSKTKLKSFEQRSESKKSTSQKEWKMIKVLTQYLKMYAMAEFVLQILYQMPSTPERQYLRYLGLTKVWRVPDETKLNYGSLIAHDPAYLKRKFQGFSLDRESFAMQCVTCVMISILFLQSEIFKSAGYQKYVSQTDGSMDILVKLASLKARSVSYVFNNQKIQKIVQIQQRKEAIVNAVENVKEKLRRWRMMARNTLDPVNHPIPEKYQVERVQKDAQELCQLLAEAEHEGSAIKSRLDANTTTIEGRVEQNGVYKQAQIGIGRGKAELRVQVVEGRAQQGRGLGLITQKEAAQIHLQLAEEFVRAKTKKLNLMSRMYLSINAEYVQKIMFKNQEKELQDIVKSHASGETGVPTELEKLMLEESLEIIKDHYDDLRGARKLHRIFRLQSTRSLRRNLLELTQFDQKYHLVDMPRTWRFTRPSSMIFMLSEAAVQACISNTGNLVYLSMILSMYFNAGLVSLVYPLSVFGYALVEETRPGRQFWAFIRDYTAVVLLIKFIFNLSIMESVFTQEWWQYWSALLQFGLHDYDSTWELFLYMLPEVSIIIFILLNELYLRLMGLYFEAEPEIELLAAAIQRNIERGDPEKVKQRHQAQKHMGLATLFAKELDDEEEDDDLASKDQSQGPEEQQRPQQRSLQQRQGEYFTYLSKKIKDSSLGFDVGDHADHRASDFGADIRSQVLQKTLESDTLIFVEGRRKILDESLEDKIIIDGDDDCLSAGDFQAESDTKELHLEAKGESKRNGFESSKYIQRVFPELRIQKPGYDLYGSTTMALVVLAAYVFLYYGKFSVDKGEYLKYLKDTSAVFSGDMAVTLIILTAIIILERYVNRSDTKASKPSRQITFEAEVQFFKKQPPSGRSSTMRTNATAARFTTMKTSEVDLHDRSAQEFLRKTYGDESQRTSQCQRQLPNSTGAITKQQKTKFVMHWVTLICGHIFVFWFIPTQSNIKLYGKPQCSAEEKDGRGYGCKNFDQNGYLRVLYVLLCVYFLLSALQLRYGFSTWKKPSSILQYDDCLPATIGAQLYVAIPFAIELRCLLDFTFAKTALDIWQFWQLFNYQLQLYLAKNGTGYYRRKVLGSQTAFSDQMINGFLYWFLMLLMLIGPIFFFSDYGGFMAPNPVGSGQLAVSFGISKTVQLKELSYFDADSGSDWNFSFQSMNKSRQEQGNNIKRDPFGISTAGRASDADSQGASANSAPALNSSRGYTAVNLYPVYRTSNLLFKRYDEEEFSRSPFGKWVETRFFRAEQLQDCVAGEYSDEAWNLNQATSLQLSSDILAAMDLSTTANAFKFQLELAYSFDRELPKSSPRASGSQIRTLNFSQKHDCETRQQLIEFAKLDCRGQDGLSSPQQKGVAIMFSQAIEEKLILGGVATVATLNRGSAVNGSEPEESREANQRRDLLLTYSCARQWTLRVSDRPTASSWGDSSSVVDPRTCTPVQELNSTAGQPISLVNQSASSTNSGKKSNGATGLGQTWRRLRFTLFSMLVSTSFLAGFNVTTFYTTVTLVAGSSLRPLFLFGTWRAWVYECTHPDLIIKVAEACYMYRHEENLVKEEETYRMLIEIIRSPEFMKTLTGSTLKGSAAPIYDKLSDAEFIKLEQLENLQRKGFDVAALKERFLKDKQQREIYEHE